MKGLLIILLFLAGSMDAHAQSKTAQQNAKLLQKASAYYKARDYNSAIAVYRQMEKNGSRTAIRKLADCYRQQYNFEMAETYYAQAVEQTNIHPDYFFNYAQTLMSNGKFEDAIIWLNKYAESDTEHESIEHMLQRCEDAINNSQKLTQNRVRALPFNTSATEFAPAYYKGGLLFTSSRIEGVTQRRDSWTNEGYLDVFYARDINGTEVEKLSGEINKSSLHDGPAIVNAKEDRIYFTRNNYEKGEAVVSKSGSIKLKIYSGEISNNNVKDLKDLSFNGNEYACSDPTISEDEMLLFFTSDHISGYGGTDIWYSQYDTAKQKWSKAINAGPVINTKGEERFPFLHSDGTLYFASGGHLGYGGLDVFMANPMAGDSIAFVSIENLGYPINTERDDFGYITNESKSKGYFASNRSGGMGGDDIYSYGTSSTLINIAVQFDGEDVEGARITIYDISGDYMLQRDVTNESGTLQGLVLPNTKYRIVVEMEGFEMLQRELETDDSGRVIRVRLNLEAAG